MEDKRLGRDRGTIAVGALAITAIFMITVACLASIIVEYNRYAYAVKTTSEKLLMRGKRKINGGTDPDKKIKVKNEGSTTSFIIGVFAVNQEDGEAKYEAIPPEAVKILSTKEIDLPKKIPKGEDWKISVLTVYGNIFWEESQT